MGKIERAVDVVAADVRRPRSLCDVHHSFTSARNTIDSPRFLLPNPLTMRLERQRPYCNYLIISICIDTAAPLRDNHMSDLPPTPMDWAYEQEGETSAEGSSRQRQNTPGLSQDTQEQFQDEPPPLPPFEASSTSNTQPNVANAQPNSSDAPPNLRSISRPPFNAGERFRSGNERPPIPPRRSGLGTVPSIVPESPSEPSSHDPNRRRYPAYNYNDLNIDTELSQLMNMATMTMNPEEAGMLFNKFKAHNETLK